MRALVAAVITFTICSTVALAEEAPRTIAVIGPAVATSRPDRAVWRITITSRAEDIGEAKELNDQKLHRLLEAAQRLNIAESDLEIGKAWVDTQYDDSAKSGRPKFRYYALYRVVIVRQRDMERFDDYFSGVVLDAESQANVTYELANEKALSDSLRIAAVADARSKAAEMAAVLGANIGRPIHISEYRPTDPDSHIRPVEEALSRQQGMRYEVRLPESVTVVSQVYVTFELQ